MYCVGLTGPIASGKSTVAAFFAQLGVDVLNADQIAKELTAKDQPAFREIIAHFGSKFLDASGELQRRLLRNYIFQHPHERLWLEQYLHPLIRETILNRMQTPPQLYYMLEIPLLTDRHHYPYLNRILAVITDTEQQIARAMLRDQHPREHIELIIQNQANLQSYQQLADDILYNKGSLQDLEQAVNQLHQQYLHACSLQSGK